MCQLLEKIRSYTYYDSRLTTHQVFPVLLVDRLLEFYELHSRSSSLLQPVLGGLAMEQRTGVSKPHPCMDASS
jgi:hypothetical protein